MADPLVSICIPAYKKPNFVLRCLRSIHQQDYKNIEVIISDDSPDEAIKEIIGDFLDLPVRYFHNPVPLKSPANWNAAIAKASGELILLLHQDDWLQSPMSIRNFAATFSNTHIDFVFCKNIGMDEEGKVILFQNKSALPNLKKHPHRLVVRNVIGPPSNVMFRKNIPVRYDENLVWLVDVDYYIRILKAGFNYFYINQYLVTIGIHEEQTTEQVRANNKVIFKENILVAKKLSEAAFKDIVFYDYYWRLLRSFEIRSLKDVERFNLSQNDVPHVVQTMLRLQKKIPAPLLRNGLASKSVMFLSYLNWRSLG